MTRVRRNAASGLLRAAVARDLFAQAIELRETLRLNGVSHGTLTYADGSMVVSSTDTQRDLLRKVDALLG